MPTIVNRVDFLTKKTGFLGRRAALFNKANNNQWAPRAVGSPRAQVLRATTKKGRRLFVVDFLPKKVHRRSLLCPQGKILSTRLLTR